MTQENRYFLLLIWKIRWLVWAVSTSFIPGQWLFLDAHGAHAHTWNSTIPWCWWGQRWEAWTPSHLHPNSAWSSLQSVPSTSTSDDRNAWRSKGGNWQSVQNNWIWAENHRKNLWLWRADRFYSAKPNLRWHENMKFAVIYGFTK